MLSLLPKAIKRAKDIWIEISSLPIVLLFNTVIKFLDNLKIFTEKKLKDLGVPIDKKIDVKDPFEYMFIMYSVAVNNLTNYTNPIVPFAFSLGNGIYTRVISKKIIYSSPSRFL